MLTKVSDIAKTIFVTSTFLRKDFCFGKSCATFALSGKKVLLIGMDFRNPRLNEYMVVQERGVTNYLSSNDLDLNDLIVKHDGYKNFHILSAGVIKSCRVINSGKVDLLLKLEIAV
jgi:septum formation inhibitor-activating ATPase MinD